MGKIKTKKRLYEQKNKSTENQQASTQSMYIAEHGVRAPFWRRICAEGVDIFLFIFAVGLHGIVLITPDVTNTMRIFYVFSLLLIIFWLFVFVPYRYFKGQTVGKKLLHVYLRDAATKKEVFLSVFLLREVGFKIILGIITWPMTVIYALWQIGTDSQTKDVLNEQSTQKTRVFKKYIVLLADQAFRTEVVYEKKQKKRDKKKK